MTLATYKLRNKVQLRKLLHFCSAFSRRHVLPHLGTKCHGASHICSVDERYLCVSMRFVWFPCARHPVDILYVSVDVCSTWVVEQSTSGHVTVKTDEYRMLNGHETHITEADGGSWDQNNGTRFDSIPTPIPTTTQYIILISFLNFTW